MHRQTERLRSPYLIRAVQIAESIRQAQEPAHSSPISRPLCDIQHFPPCLRRCLGIEHFGGDFPLWLAPEQIRLVPISDKVLDYITKFEVSGLNDA